MSKIKEYLIPTLVLFVICFVSAALLGVTNEKTAPKIEENAVKTRQEAMKEVLPFADSFGDEEIAADSVRCKYNIAYDTDGNVVGYAVTATGDEGFGGDITVMVGIDAEGKVTKVKDLKQNSETASLGGKLLKAANGFLDKYIGKSGSVAINKDGGDIEAKTGATKTSRGITHAVDNALKCYTIATEGTVTDNG